MSLLDQLRFADDESVQQPALASTGDVLATLGTGAVAAPAGLLSSWQSAEPGDSPSLIAARGHQRAGEATWAPRTKAGAAVLDKIATGLGSVAHNADNFFGGIPGHVYRSILKHHPEVAATAGMVATLLGVAVPEGRLGSTVNIGLHIGDGTRKLTSQGVRDALAARGVKVLKGEVRQSGTDPTFVATLDRALSKKDAASLSSELEQDAIAQRVHGKAGQLHGPKAKEWGPYNEDYFLDHATNEEQAAFKDAADPNAPMPQLADRYPETLPSVLKVDKKTGKEYQARNNSAEAQQVLALRAAHNADMDANPDWQRFFNPDERFYADPTFHPDTQPQTLDIRPKKQATTDQHMARVNTRENVDLLKALAGRVKDDTRAHHWYAMGQAQREAQIAHGDPHAGAEAFDRHFSTPMGATTALADPETNLMSTGFANFRKRGGESAAMESHEAPVPTSGIALKGNLANADKFDLMDSLKTEDNPKRRDFVKAFNGHHNVGVMDKVMTGILDKNGPNAPPAGQYGIYETPVHTAAAEMGLPTVEAQARPWIATQMESDPKYVPRPMIEELNRAIERTHRITGTPRKEIFDRVFAGKGKRHALYSAAGAALLSRFAQQDGGA